MAFLQDGGEADPPVRPLFTEQVKNGAKGGAFMCEQVSVHGRALVSLQWDTHPSIFPPSSSPETR